MKTTGHGIEESGDVEDVYHLRLMALLQELVRRRGHKGAARLLEVDPQTVTESAKTGQLSRRVREALERALQEGVGSAAARQRARNEQIEGRVDELAHGYDELGEELRKRLAAVEGEVAAMRRDDARGNGAGQANAGPGAEGSGEARAGAGRVNGGGRSRPPVRREYPDLATLEPAEDDDEVFGDAWPLIVEWRGLKGVHPNRGKGLAWLAAAERLLEVELALLEGHGMTLPPEKRPLHGFDRDGQTTWRRTALLARRRERAGLERRRWVRRVLTLGLWWG